MPNPKTMSAGDDLEHVMSETSIDSHVVVVRKILNTKRVELQTPTICRNTLEVNLSMGKLLDTPTKAMLPRGRGAPLEQKINGLGRVRDGI